MNIVILERNQASGARICASQLIVHEYEVCYLEGFGPESEIRAFAQMLNDGGYALKTNSENTTLYNVSVSRECTIRMIPLTNDYYGIMVLPMTTGYIVANSEQEAMNVFSRYLDQNHFCYTPWYEHLFSKTEEIEPLVGNKVCKYNKLQVERLVIEGLQANNLVMPDHYRQIDVADPQSEDAA